jgi:hypothetical protein
MWRYAVTIFISAFLLFSVQPLIGRFVLPWFGGGPGVWSGCLLFFQIALLVGFAYTLLLVRRLPSKGLMWVHLALLLAAALVLPIVPSESWKPAPGGEPVLQILLLLCVTIGLPFVVLSSTAPLMQAWFARAMPDRSPYRLYALSNAGSLLALLGYPFIVEPLLSRNAQAIIWSCGFVVFVLLCAWTAVSSRDSTSRAACSSASATRREPLARGCLEYITLPS